MENPSFYAIIPANVRYDKDLTPNAKLLYAEITSLCNLQGHCWATNDYFSNLYGVSKVSISKWISQLIEKGYIQSEIVYKDGTKQILNRYLTLLNGPIKEKLMGPIKENFKENIIDTNNKINNSAEIKKSFKNFDVEDFKNEILQIKEKANGKYTNDMIKKFFNYWSEKDAKGKMRFQKQETWETGKRLATWYGNNFK